MKVMKPRTLITPLLLLGFALILFENDVRACNAPPIPPEGTVKGASLIVRATPLEVLEDGLLKFKVLEVLKGEDAPSPLIIKGSLSKSDDYNERPVPYSHVRPSGSAPCYAREYKEGAEFLLMLKEQDGKLTPYWYPLAPTNEQLRPGEDAWLAWVRNFSESQKNKEAKAR